MLNLIFKSLLACVAFFISWQSHSHLMHAQHGTLNFDTTGGYLVLSLPASAFHNFDQNQNGKLELSEIKMQQSKMIAFIENKLYLRHRNTKIPLSGALLAPQKSHGKDQNVIDQLVVMGKFITSKQSELTLVNKLYGKQNEQQKIKITATRNKNSNRHILQLTPSDYAVNLFIPK